MSYWLIKSEPSTFSIDDLAREPEQTACWDGVRNYQARNMMRDDMKVGDLAFFYHSSCQPPGIVGIVQVVKEAYPDYTAWDPEAPGYDPKSSPEKPRWFMVDIQLVEKFPDKVTLHTLREQSELQGMPLLRRGNRLSIMPVTEAEWAVIRRLSE